MNFREMRAKLISTYGRFVFFPTDPEIPKIISTAAFTHLVIDEEITLYAPKVMEEQVEGELEEGYDVVYGEPEFRGTYKVSPRTAVSNPGFKFEIGLDELRKAMRKPFPEELEIVREFSNRMLEALEKFWGEIEIGMSVEDAQSLLNSYLMRYGADGLSYPTIVAVGEVSRYPLPRTGGGRIEEGKIIYVDASPQKSGYSLSFSRVIFTEERKEWIESLNRINSMYRYLSENIHAGVRCNELDSMVRRIGDFPHYSAVPSGGFYEPYAPGDCILEENHLLTVVPSIYLEDGVIRVKRNIIVRKRGVEFLL